MQPEIEIEGYYCWDSAVFFDAYNARFLGGLISFLTGKRMIVAKSYDEELSEEFWVFERDADRW